MRLEFMPLHLNVVRFPLERRLPPSLRVLRAIAPDLREAAMVAEAFGLPELTPELRGASEAKMARRLREERVPTEPAARRAALALMGRPWVAGAVRACSRAAEMMAEAGMAQRRYVVVLELGDVRATALGFAADTAALAAAHAFLAAARRSEEVEGAMRALDLACNGELGYAYDAHIQADGLVLRHGRGMM